MRAGECDARPRDARDMSRATATARRNSNSGARAFLRPLRRTAACHAGPRANPLSTCRNASITQRLVLWLHASKRY
eukprot:1190140-Prorocentrum_minimum.AAC.6